MGLLRKRMEALWRQGSNKDPATFLRKNAADLQRVLKVAAMYLHSCSRRKAGASVVMHWVARDEASEYAGRGRGRGDGIHMDFA